ncbi:MAG: hypothetical protein U0452_08040 [Anaerolineae bacterium]
MSASEETVAVVPSLAVSEVVYPLDPEHWKLRAVVLGAFFGVGLLIIVLTSSLLSSDGISLIGVIGGLAGGYAASAVAERYLKGRWHSPRSLRLSANGLQLTKGNTLEQEVPITNTVTSLRWKFEITKRARVPKGWWMYACYLSAGDRQITVYTFISPKENDVFVRAPQFVRLYGKKERERKEREKLGTAPPQSLRQAGEERRLREAEEHRWLLGGEMSYADFTDFLDRLDKQFQEWTPLSS